MKNKISSLLLWITVWWILILWHSFLNTDSIELNKNSWSKWEVNDEQISRISERTGISEEEIKTRLESWETMRDIMWAAGKSGGWWEWRVRWE